MRKVLFLTHTLDFRAGGAERVLFDLLRKLDRKQFEVLLSAPRENAQSVSKFLELDITSIELAPLPLSMQRTIWKSFATGVHLVGLSFAIALCLLRFRPSIVYVNSIVSLHFGFFPAWLMRIPIVYHEHNLVTSREESVWHWLFPFFAKRVSRIVAITEAVRKELLDLGVDASRVIAIHNGIEPRRETSTGSASDSPFEQFPDGIFVGQIASVLVWKGHETVLRAMPILLKEEPVVRYVAFGQVIKPEHYAHLLRLREELQLQTTTLFAGFREDIEELLPQLRCLLVASTAEPFGLVVLQAMRAGVPVIATARGGIPEIIEHEVNGLLIEPNDPEGMASAVLRILRDPELRKKIIANGYKTVQEKFSITAQVRSIESILAEVA